MMSANHTNRISSLQYCFILIVSAFGLGNMYFPRMLVTFAGSSAFLAFACVGLLALVSLKLQTHIASLAPDLPLSDLRILILGRPLGIFIESLYALFLIVFMAATLREFAIMLHTFFYPLTPAWGLSSSIILLVAVTSASGPVVMARTIQALVLPTLAFYLVSSLLLFNLHHFPAAMAFGTNIALSDVFSGTYHGLYIFAGIPTIVYLVPHLLERKPQRLWAYTVMGFLVFFLSLALALFNTISLFGIHHTPLMVWPFATALRMLTFPGFFVNRLGLLVVITWVALIYGFLAVQTWLVAKLLRSSFSQLHISRGIFGYAVTASVLIVEIMLPGELGVHMIVRDVIMPFSAVFILALPLLTALVAFARGPAFARSLKLHYRHLPKRLPKDRRAPLR